MAEKIALLAICFTYSSNRRLRLEAVPKDLKKVLNYATWLKAKFYLVSDFVPGSEGAKISERLGLSGPTGGLEGSRMQPRVRIPIQHEAESADAKSICSFADAITEPYIVVYYSGHATNKSIFLPDGSKLSVATLHQRLVQSDPRGICWILDACELSGKSLRLPFLCRKNRVSRIMPHGLHVVPTIALSATLCRSADSRGEESIISASEYERGLRTEPRSFITDDNGSLFTSSFIPLLMDTSPIEWAHIFGTLSQCCGYRDGQPMCLKLHAFVSDVSLSILPLWMRKRFVEPQGKFWIIRR